MSWNRVIQVTRGGRADPSYHSHNSREPNHPPSYLPSDHHQYDQPYSDSGPRQPNYPPSEPNTPRQYNRKRSNSPQSHRGRPQSDRGRPHSDRGRPQSDRGCPPSGRGHPRSDRGHPRSDQGRPQSNQPFLISRPNHEPWVDDHNDEAELEHRGIVPTPLAHPAQITRTIAQDNSPPFHQGPSNDRVVVTKKAEHITNRLGPPVQEKPPPSKPVVQRLGSHPSDKLDSPEVRKKRAERFNQSPNLAVGKTALATGSTDRGPAPQIHIKKRVKRLSDRKVVVLNKPTNPSPKQPAHPVNKGKAKAVAPNKTTSTYGAVRDQMNKSTAPAPAPVQTSKPVPSAISAQRNPVKTNPVKANPVKPKVVTPAAPAVSSPKVAVSSPKVVIRTTPKPTTPAAAPSKVVSLKRAPAPESYQSHESNKKLARAAKFSAPQSDSSKPPFLVDDFLSLDDDVPVEEKTLFKRTPITAPAKTDRAATEELIAINSDEDTAMLWDEVVIEPSSSRLAEDDKPIASNTPSTSKTAGGDLAQLKKTIVQKIDSGVVERGANKLPNFDGLIDKIVEKILADPEIKQSLVHKEPTPPTTSTKPSQPPKPVSTKPVSSPKVGGARPRKKALTIAKISLQTTKHTTVPQQSRKASAPKVVTTYHDHNRSKAPVVKQKPLNVRPQNPREDNTRQQNARPQNPRTGDMRNVTQKQVQQPRELLAKYAIEPKASSSNQGFPPRPPAAREQSNLWQSCNTSDPPQQRQTLLPSPLLEQLQRGAQHSARPPPRQDPQYQQQPSQFPGYQGNQPQQQQTLLQQAISTSQEYSTGRSPAIAQQQYLTGRTPASTLVQQPQYLTGRTPAQHDTRGSQYSTERPLIQHYSTPLETNQQPNVGNYYQPLAQQQPSFQSSPNPANHSQMQTVQSEPPQYNTNHAETSHHQQGQYSGQIQSNREPDNRRSGQISSRERDNRHSGEYDRRAKKQSLHCKSCHAKFDNPTLLQEHLQSVLHLMVNGEWWKTHRPPPKTITSQDVIWCVCCQKDFRFTSIKSLTDHMVDSVSHGKARRNWVKRFDAPPKYDWCLYSSIAGRL